MIQSLVWNGSLPQSTHLPYLQDVTKLFVMESEKIATAHRNGKVHIWDQNLQTALAEIPAHDKAVTALGQVQKLLITGSEDFSVKIWAPPAQPRASLIGHRTSIIEVLGMGADRVVSMSAEMKVKVWNWETGQCTFSTKDPLLPAICKVSEQFVAVAAENMILLWNLNEKISQEVLKAPGNHRSILQLSDRTLVTLTMEGESLSLCVRNAMGNCIKKTEGIIASSKPIELRDRAHIVVACDNNRAKILAASTLEEIALFEAGTSPICSMVELANGAIATVAASGNVRIWNPTFPKASSSSQYAKVDPLFFLYLQDEAETSSAPSNKKNNIYQKLVLRGEEGDLTDLLESSLEPTLLRHRIDEIDERNEKLSKENARLLQQLNSLQGKQVDEMQKIRLQLDALKVHQDVLVNRGRVEREKEQKLREFKTHPNLLGFYKRFQTKIEGFFISAKSLAGGFVVGQDGNLSNISKGFELLGEVIDITPFVGGIGKQLINLIFVTGIQKLDEERQKNLAGQMADLATLTEIEREAEDAARQLTDYFKPILEMLIDEEGEKKEVSLFQKAKQVVLKKRPISPAEQVAELCVAVILEKLKSNNQDSTLSLAQQFVKSVVLPDPPSAFSSPKVFKKIFGKTLCFKGGAKVSMGDLITKVGIQTRDGCRYGSRDPDFDTYGYCLGTHELAKKRGLQLVSSDSVSRTQAPASPTQEGPFVK